MTTTAAQIASTEARLADIEIVRAWARLIDNPDAREALTIVVDAIQLQMDRDTAEWERQCREMESAT